jgi:N-acetylglucosamine malate deacetylase 1
MTNKSVLVVVAHPDDEILGCGGTMARHVVDGDEVDVLFMADGVTARRHAESTEGKVEERNYSAELACKVIGTHKPRFLGFPDNRMDSCSILDITQTLERVIDELSPRLIYTHHDKDLNIDHQLTHQAVMTACRPQPKSSVSEIYSFEVLSSTGWGSPTANNTFVPNSFVDVTGVWEKKMEALQCYNAELRDFPHARSYKSVEALARYRGVSVGLEYAEAFQLERKIRHGKIGSSGFSSGTICFMET